MFLCLMDWSRVIFIKDDYKTDKFPSEYELDDEESDRHSPPFKAKSIFQIMYYHASHGRHKTQTHVMSAHTVYEKYKNRALINAFNKQCMWISHKSS